ncbi:hypothetical protein [Nocardia arthritidis]|uniref:Uncharacterized protein n=1 Tax=Nocardia arthritidis TaxID=228602 RepID=A0A6G9YD87_9NOCA|nr:hypothetical protein [Nocardia arthritidis]QIS11138.1 hypothetical protein F5544_16295 [Nocardia arthritidis]
MDRRRVFGIARVGGHAFWWVFVVAMMIGGGFTWLGTEARRAGFAGVGRECGWWTSGFVTGVPRRYADYLPNDSINVLTEPATYALIAFGLVVLAAVVEAVLCRRLVAGLVTVAVPLVSGVGIAFAAHGLDASVEFTPILTLVIVLAAVALREVWMRAFAPAVPMPVPGRGGEGESPEGA